MDARKRYPSDLTDLQWYNIEHLFQCAARGKGGRPRTYPLRDVVDALFYLARSGCAWRMLPHDFPPWGLVSYYFYTWRDAGLLERLHAALQDRDAAKPLLMKARPLLPRLRVVWADGAYAAVAAWAARLYRWTLTTV